MEEKDEREPVEKEDDLPMEETDLETSPSQKSCSSSSSSSIRSLPQETLVEVDWLLLRVARLVES